jgi:hypothetical protein
VLFYEDVMANHISATFLEVLGDLMPLRFAFADLFEEHSIVSLTPSFVVRIGVETLVPTLAGLTSAASATTHSLDGPSMARAYVWMQKIP